MILEIFKENPQLVNEIRQGIERECLRVDEYGEISKNEHHKNLGSKLTHPNITTDYSENLLEFITNVHHDTSSLLKELNSLHAFTQNNIENEFFWNSSMPARLSGNDLEIPLAYYGNSNVGKLKTLYRMGLGHRYGRSMQVISGVHYNFSLSDSFWNKLKINQNSDLSIQELKSQNYFSLVRNFNRYKSLLTYLFGSTSAVDKSFLVGKKHNLEKLTEDTYYTPTGTSLRMGGLGYTSNAQKSITVCYDYIETYVKTLEAARLRSMPEYEKIGLSDEFGLKQLNTNLLQIDNEYYSTIRPKNIARSRESALMALHKRGVEYIEVRLLDVDFNSEVGITSSQIDFLHMFLLFCLTEDSPMISEAECQELNENFESIVLKGRSSDTKLFLNGKSSSISDYYLRLFDKMEALAGLFSEKNPEYLKAIKDQRLKIENPDLLPSNILLDKIGTIGFHKFHLSQSRELKSRYHLSKEEEESLSKLALQSWVDQKDVEARDKLPFNEFLIQYFKDIKLDF